MAGSFEHLHRQIEVSKFQVLCGEFGDFEYRTLKRGLEPEALANVDKPRFVVTNLPAEGFQVTSPEALRPALRMNAFNAHVAP